MIKAGLGMRSTHIYHAVLVLVLTAAGQRSYYDVLEVSKDVATEGIKKAYRQQALKWHPDKNKDPEAPQRFHEISEAYEVLVDPDRRKEYDGGAGGLHFDFHDFAFRDADAVFKEFFGDEDPWQTVNNMVEQMNAEIDRVERESASIIDRVEEESSSIFSSIASFFFGSPPSPAPKEDTKQVADDANAETKIEAAARKRSEEAESLKIAETKAEEEKVARQIIEDEKARKAEAADAKSKGDAKIAARQKAEAEEKAQREDESSKLKAQQDAADAKSKADAKVAARKSAKAEEKAKREERKRAEAEEKAQRMKADEEASKLKVQQEAADAKAKADIEVTERKRAEAQEMVHMKVEEEASKRTVQDEVVDANGTVDAEVVARNRTEDEEVEKAAENKADHEVVATGKADKKTTIADEGSTDRGVENDPTTRKLAVLKSPFEEAPKRADDSNSVLVETLANASVTMPIHNSDANVDAPNSAPDSILQKEIGADGSVLNSNLPDGDQGASRIEGIADNMNYSHDIENHQESIDSLNSNISLQKGSQASSLPGGILSGLGSFGNSAIPSGASPFDRMLARAPITSTGSAPIRGATATPSGTFAPNAAISGSASSFGSLSTLSNLGAVPQGGLAGRSPFSSSRENSDASCTSAALRNGVEPVDTEVGHVEGSACCNSSPKPEATDSYGCCQRCLSSARCEVFVWQPSTGSCWLLRWKQPSRTPVIADDRISASRPGLSWQ